MNEELIDLQTQLASVEARKAELEFTFKEAKVAARQTTADEVLVMVKRAGFDFEEIRPLLESKPAKKDAAARSRVQWPRMELIGDPSKTYARGRFPAWLKEAMLAVGMQPEMAEHRAAFKAQYMMLVA